ncbi:nuclear transport factor 2 family protein [Pseudonocardia oroxyli]|uniref:SnoaL-like domain-containing protein n=1 Tax=Pseudonocardia oroxyli TaxID=366584 RepID=A0A1G7TLQ8_PSEOR|nr:nuclear transport factor 2 family protein [Pseudonocardia oroxyli]SDG35944.1 SnoaL-like domain-containing protein [Pseudonocardia oroxyli]
MNSDEVISRLEIRDALQRYCRGLDRRDRPVAVSAFHADSHIVHGHFAGTGPDWVDWLFAEPPTDRVGIGDADPALDVVESQQHHLTNQLIDLEGDVAYSEAYFLEYTLTMRGAERFLTSVGGRYVERYERREVGWRIAERFSVRDWDSVTLVETRFPGWERSPQGARDRSDPTYRPGFHREGPVRL